MAFKLLPCIYVNTITNIFELNTTCLFYALYLNNFNLIRFERMHLLWYMYVKRFSFYKIYSWVISKVLKKINIIILLAYNSLSHVLAANMVIHIHYIYTQELSYQYYVLYSVFRWFYDQTQVSVRIVYIYGSANPTDNIPMNIQCKLNDRT